MKGVTLVVSVSSNMPRLPVSCGHMRYACDMLSFTIGQRVA